MKETRTSKIETGGEGPQDVGREKERSSVTFHVAEHGSSMSLDEVLSAEDFESRDQGDFEPNRHWHEVTVTNEADKDAWVALKNEWLELQWTPNQTDEERAKNAVRMHEIETEMEKLEQGTI